MRFTLRIPKVEEGVYDLSVDPGVRSSDVESSRLALREPLYIRDASVTPVRSGTKFFHSPDPHHLDLPLETVINGQFLANGLPTGAPEIDDPIADALSYQYSHKPLWTFGRLEYTCFGGANTGMQVNSDDWQPMYIDHIIRAANILTGHTMGDPLGYIRTGEASWHGATYHPLIALLKPFVSEPSWMRYAAPSASPHLGTCTAGTYGLVDDSDIQRTFTIEDPRVVHPEWDPALRTLMLDFKVRIGMTHEMVAFAMGYPSMSGTTAKLAQLPEWSWRPYSSCWADAKFEGDRVVKFSGSTECGSTIDIY